MKSLAALVLATMVAAFAAEAAACPVCGGAVAAGIFDGDFSMRLVLLMLPLLLIVAVVLALHNLPDNEP